MIITSDYGSFPHSLLSTSKNSMSVLHKAGTAQAQTIQGPAQLVQLRVAAVIPGKADCDP